VAASMERMEKVIPVMKYWICKCTARLDGEEVADARPAWHKLLCCRGQPSSVAYVMRGGPPRAEPRGGAWSAHLRTRRDLCGRWHTARPHGAGWAIVVLGEALAGMVAVGGSW
jgi:hypothetical protein